MDENIEIWGTFAVADHLRPQPFVADVLLYDRLVLPVPKAGHRDAEWRGAWASDRLAPLLDLLGDLAVPMPWGADEHEDALRRHDRARAVTQDMQALRAAGPDAPHFHVTRAVLADYANAAADHALFTRLRALAKRPGTRVEAVTAFPSPQDMASGLGLGPAPGPGGGLPQRAAAVLDWTFNVPSGEDDRRLLSRAVALARRPDFREHRAWFYRHLRDLPGLEAEAVRADLQRRMADYDRILRGQRTQTVARRATQVLLLAPGLISAIDPLAGALAGAAVGLAAYGVSEHLPRPVADDRTRVAAMASDVRAALGDRLRAGPAT